MKDCCQCNQTIINSLAFKGANLQMAGLGHALVDADAEVPFNSIAANNIGLTNSDGIITLTRIGTYQANWQVAVDGTDGSANISLGLSLNDIIVGASTFAQVQGQISGSAVFIVSSVPAVLKLINKTTGIIAIPSVPYQANLSILGQ